MNKLTLMFQTNYI